MITTNFTIEGGDQVVVVIHDNLTVDLVYDHLVRSGIYSMIRSSAANTVTRTEIVNDFLKDLR